MTPNTLDEEAVVGSMMKVSKRVTISNSSFVELAFTRAIFEATVAGESAQPASSSSALVIRNSTFMNVRGSGLNQHELESLVLLDSSLHNV